MSTWFQRSFVFFIIFTIGIASLLITFLGLPTIENWKPLLTIQQQNFPIGGWIIIVIFVLSIGISSYISIVNYKNDRLIERYVRHALNIDKHATHAPGKISNTRLRKTLDEMLELTATQKRRLQKLTEEYADGEDKRIQERLIQERQRLARELHDSVSQQLFAASMLLSSLTEQQNNTLLAQTEKIIQQAQLEMRALLLHLRPAALHSKTLSQGLQELLEELQQKVQFTIRFRLETFELSKGIEDHLFRIAQETLSNTLRHANASEVDILLVNRDGFVIFRVQDNGVGFQHSEEHLGSYGLQNIHERAIEIGGTSKIISVPSQGTIIEVKIPLNQED